MKTLFGAASLLAVALGSVPATAADLTVAAPNWSSGRASAAIIKAGLERTLKLDVAVEDMGTLIAFAGLDGGSVDVHPEVWQPNLNALVKQYVTDRGSVQLSPTSVSAAQGLCVTRATYEAGIRDISDLLDPAKTAIFDTDGDGKGEMWIGDRGWSSTDIERIRAKSYGYAATMTLLEMPEEVGLAAVDSAVATGRPIVFFCYRPHFVFDLHDIVQLTEPAHDPARWTIVLPADDPDWLAKSDAPVGWDASKFNIAYSSSLARNRPQVARFLDRIDFSVDEVTAMSYALEVERKDPADYAREWVAAHADRVDGWARP